MRFIKCSIREGVLSEHVIKIGKLTFAGGSALVRQLMNLPDAKKYILDFSGMSWVEPFPMLHVASAIGGAVRMRPTSTFTVAGADTNGYAAYMGFFRHCGIGIGPAAGTVQSNVNYLPITALDISELRQEAGEKNVAIGNVIERHAGDIAKTLIRSGYGDVWGTLQYAIREIIRNVAEHSQSSRVLYCGQYWPAKNEVEVAILDEGIGIARSLRDNPHLRVNQDVEALRLSVLPGISGKAWAGANVDHSDKWSNSGFGLYVVSELCKRGGEFDIVSGEAALCITKDSRKSVSSCHSGTALKIKINTENLRSIAASLALIVSKGERIAQNVLQMEKVEASFASKIERMADEEVGSRRRGR
jgi:hypothetical protein